MSSNFQIVHNHMYHGRCSISIFQYISYNRNLGGVRNCDNKLYFGYLKELHRKLNKGLYEQFATVCKLQKAVKLRLKIRYRQHADWLHFFSGVFRLQKGLQLYMSLNYICPVAKERHNKKKYSGNGASPFSSLHLGKVLCIYSKVAQLDNQETIKVNFPVG